MSSAVKSITLRARLAIQAQIVRSRAVGSETQAPLLDLSKCGDPVR
jgi:hypothetical protein